MSAAEQLVGLLCSWRPSGNVAGRSGETVLFCCCCTGPLRRRGRIIDLSFGRRTAAGLDDAAADFGDAVAGNVVAADDAADFGGAVAADLDDAVAGNVAAGLGQVCDQSDMTAVDAGCCCYLLLRGKVLTAAASVGPCRDFCCFSRSMP